MISKYPLSLLGVLVLGIGSFFAFRQTPPTPSEYSWFVARMAEDFYKSDPEFNTEEKEWFLEWYVKGFLNGYLLLSYFGSDEKFAPRWEGYLQGKHYQKRNPHSMDEVMQSYGYTRVSGSGIWKFGFEQNGFQFKGSEAAHFAIELLDNIYPRYDPSDLEGESYNVHINGYAGPEDAFGYIFKYKLPFNYKRIYVTSIEFQQ